MRAQTRGLKNRRLWHSNNSITRKVFQPQVMLPTAKVSGQCSLHFPHKISLMFYSSAKLKITDFQIFKGISMMRVQPISVNDKLATTFLFKSVSFCFVFQKKKQYTNLLCTECDSITSFFFITAYIVNIHTLQLFTFKTTFNNV